MTRLLLTIGGAGVAVLGSTAVIYLVMFLDHRTTSPHVTESKVLIFEDRRRRRASRLTA